MIFDSLRQGSTATAAEGSSCRRNNVLPDIKIGETQLDYGTRVAKKPKSFRRKKMELRRIRSLSVEKAAGRPLFLPDDNVSSKKKRSEIRLIENGLVVQLPERDVGGSRRVACVSLSHGTISVIGRRREMEDAVAAELGFLKRGAKSYNFFGVYDGHGGWRVAHACSEMLHRLLVKIVEEDNINAQEIVWERVMAAAFKMMDEEVNKKGAAVATTGSTALVAVVGEGEVVVGNCGDSRAVLSRGGVAVQLSDDHKPDRPDELERIEACGGKVINWNGHRVLGVLATSRSIGDHYLKPFVITDPEVKIINRTKSDEFLVLASDGLWDVISNDLACQVARRCLDGQIRSSHSSSSMKEDIRGSGRRFEYDTEASRSVEAAAVLAELAMAKGSHDNISVVIVDLRNSSHYHPYDDGLSR